MVCDIKERKIYESTTVKSYIKISLDEIGSNNNFKKSYKFF